MSEFTEIQSTCVCDGTGKYVLKSRDRIGSTMTSCSYMTQRCVCRKDEPPREGQAAWWSLETVFREQALAILDPIVVSVSPEVPMSEENHRLVRRGNRYYPTTISVEDGANSFRMHPDEARKLAQHLIAAADAADQIDHQDTDTCGHWYPCDCGQVKAPA